MAMLLWIDEPAPVGDINTTPLIDVMLVLLIMFIITIPLQTHAVKLDLPGPEPQPLPVNPVTNRVTISEEGGLLWNGRPTSLAGLRTALDASAQMPRQPELQLLPEERARYALVDQVLAMTKAARVERVGFVGNERYSRF